MKWLVLFAFSILLLGCDGNQNTPQTSTDSIVEETTASGDTVLIRYPKNNDSWNMVGYYEEGSKYREAHIHQIDSSEIMDAIWYYPNGQIWKYKLYSYNFLRYYRDYDDSGKVVKSKGIPFANVDSVNELIVPEVGNMERFLHAGTIPYCRISLMVSDYDLRFDTTQHARDNSFIIDELITPDATYPIDFQTRDAKTQYVFWLIEDTLTGDSENGFFIDRFVFE